MVAGISWAVLTLPGSVTRSKQETTILLRDEPNGKIPTTGALKRPSAGCAGRCASFRRPG